jgi:hypothetical protein
MDAFQYHNSHTDRNEMFFSIKGEISNRCAALENLDTEAGVNKAWETIRI